MPRYVTRGRKTRQRRPRPISRRKFRKSLRPASYRRRKSGGMTKKRILNITAQKKRDTMMNWSNSTSSSQSGGATYTNSAAIVNGGLLDSQAAVFLWCATARDNTSSYQGSNGTKFQQATRTSSTPYMVGLSEKIEIQCNTGMPWQWRRICFTMKGTPLVPTNAASGATFSPAAETSNGWVRMMNQVPGNPGNNPMYGLMVPLFKGQVGSDWIDPMTAMTDNSRVTIKYDKTITLASGNEDGFIRKYTRWHPMRKTLVYDDDENGGSENASQYSVTGKAGMGDYYVVDMFRARSGSSTTDQLQVRPEATLYWHEK
ncbi:capsid protein [Tortoise genomovirus 4]|nr:capsid protein [Tortoise genomovirus 4]